MKPRPDESFRVQAPLWPLLLGLGVLGPFAFLSLREALRMLPDFEKASLPAFIGVLCLVPLVIGGRRVSFGARTLLLDRDGVTFRSEHAGHLLRFAWTSLAPIEVRVVHVGHSTVRAVWLRDQAHTLEVLEQHIGGRDAFERLVASLQSRRDEAHRAPAIRDTRSSAG